MAIDYVALKTELTTDPAGLGYATLWATGADTALADILNTVRQTIDIDRGVIPSYEVINATAPAEWTALSAAEKQRYQTLTGAGQTDSGNANVRAAFNTMFPQGSSTRTSLIGLLTRKGSRAEFLFGQAVTSNDVAQARKA